MPDEKMEVVVRELNALLNQRGIAEVLSKIEAGTELPDLSGALRDLHEKLPSELKNLVDLDVDHDQEELWPRRLLSILLLLKNCTDDQIALVADIVGNMLKKD